MTDAGKKPITKANSEFFRSAEKIQLAPVVMFLQQLIH